MLPWLRAQVKRWRHRPHAPDPRVAVLATELKIASDSLDRAARAMKHAHVTPMLITQTKTASTRGRQALAQCGIRMDEE